MQANENALNWFEIPAADINRAKTFYSTVFDTQMQDMGEQMGMKMVGFPQEMGNGKVSGGLVQGPNHKPSTDGAVPTNWGRPALPWRSTCFRERTRPRFSMRGKRSRRSSVSCVRSRIQGIWLPASSLSPAANWSQASIPVATI